MKKASSPGAAAELAEEYFRHLQARNMSPHTLSNYRRDIEALLRALADRPLADLSYDDLLDLAEQETRRGLSAQSVSRSVSAWRMFLSFAIQRGVILSNPAEDLKIKKRSSLPRALTPDQMKAFLEAPLAESEAGKPWLVARDTAMFEILYSSGLRVSEMTALDESDIDLSAGLVQVRRGKGGRPRTAPLGSVARRALENWLSLRRNLLAGRPAAAALFVNARGGRLSSRTVQMRVAVRARMSPALGRVSPHVLRHSCASHFLQSSGDLRATQELLGHSSVAATQIYTRLDFAHLAQSYDKAHPRARKPGK